MQVKSLSEATSSNASKSATPGHQSSDSAKNIPSDSDSDMPSASSLSNSASYVPLNKLKNGNRADSTSSQKSLDILASSNSRSSFSDGEIIIMQGELNLPKQSMMKLSWKKRWCVIKASDIRSRYDEIFQNALI